MAEERPRGTRTPGTGNRERLGGLLWTEIAGTRLRRGEGALIAGWGIGGAVLFKQNLRSLGQSRRLVGQLVEASGGRLVFIAADQEGGRVIRLPPPATAFPSAMALAATGDPGLAEAAAMTTARELRTFGITVNLAPVVDVGVIPLNPSVGTRAFGSTPEVVTEFARAQVRGYLAGGVLPVLKHFPGKGGTAVDPHLDLPIIRDGLNVLEGRDLPPFRALAREAPAVMVGHANFHALDPRGLSATLSEPVYRLLRDTLGYEGLVLTDALRMQAVADRHGVPEAAVMALAAGADVVLPLREESACLARMEQAVSSGEVPGARIEQALAHVEEARRRLAELPAGGDAPVPWHEHAELARVIARRALTVLRDEPGLLPLSRKVGTLLVEFAVDGLSQVEEGRETASHLLVELLRFNPGTEVLLVDAREVTPAVREQALRTAQRCEQLVIATREAHLLEPQANLAHELLQARREAVVVGLRSPDLSALDDAPTYLAAYSDVPASLRAVAEAVFGEGVPL